MLLLCYNNFFIPFLIFQIMKIRGPHYGRTRLQLNYGEIYEFSLRRKEPIRGVYIGSDLKGKGRILHFESDYSGKINPPVLSFNLWRAYLHKRLIEGTSFQKLSLSEKERSFALEILAKKFF